MAILLVNSLEHGTLNYYNQTAFSWNLAFGGNGVTINSTATGLHRTTSGVGSNYRVLMDDSYFTPSGVFQKTITAFADYSGTIAGTVLATSQGHGLTSATSVIISGTTNYNGQVTITPVDADTFYFTDTWVANEAPAMAQFIPKFMHFWEKAVNNWSVQFPQGNTQQFEVAGLMTGNIVFYRGGTLVQTNVGAWVPNVAHWIVLELVAVESGTGYCKVWIDDVNVATFTGDTRNTSTDGWDGVGLGNCYTGGSGFINQGTYYDDIIVTDDATGRLGEQIGSPIVPNADTTPNDLVAMSGAGAGTPTGGDNYATVDEIPFSDTDWNQASTTGQTDRYDMSSAPAGISAITFVQFSARAARDGDITKGEVTVDSGGTVRYGFPTRLPAAPSYLGIPYILIQDPNTGVAWTVGGINAVKAGLRFTSG